MQWTRLEGVEGPTTLAKGPGEISQPASQEILSKFDKKSNTSQTKITTQTIKFYNHRF